jgi:hypothetical protein
MTADPATPSPYELYTRYPLLRSTWTTDPGWTQGVVVTAGYQAAELCLWLIDDALRDDRPAALTDRRLRRLAHLLVTGLETLHELLADEREVPPASHLRQDTADEESSGGSGASSAFRVLLALEAHEVSAVARAISSRPLPFRTGVESCVAEACDRHGVPRPGSDPRLPLLDHHRVVRPDVVRRLRATSPSGPEDHLFRSAHQITECWLRIAEHHFDLAERLAGEKRWAPAAEHAERAARAVDRAVDAAQLLDLMNLADFHPLSVRLRDASGAQSVAARRLTGAPRRLFRPLAAELAERGRTVATLLDTPETALAEYRYLLAVKTVGKTCQSFLFQHYLLALNVHGADNKGGLGYGIHQLAERALRPPLPEIDEQHHALSQIMRLRHAASAGVDVLRDEPAGDTRPPEVDGSEARCPAEVQRAVVDAYFRHVDARDADGWVALFEPVRGQLRDLRGTRPYRGSGHLKVYVHALFDMFPSIRSTCSPARIDGNTAEVAWRFEVTHELGAVTEFEGTARFHFDGDGLITLAETFWHPEAVAERVWPPAA